jgi:hypothetical protein
MPPPFTPESRPGAFTHLLPQSHRTSPVERRVANSLPGSASYVRRVTFTMPAAVQPALTACVFASPPGLATSPPETPGCTGLWSSLPAALSRRFEHNRYRLPRPSGYLREMGNSQEANLASPWTPSSFQGTRSTRVKALGRMELPLLVTIIPAPASTSNPTSADRRGSTPARGRR